MVGAGFSRCGADLPAPDSLQPPLWWDFAWKMWASLYPEREFSNADPLRLAQEYAVAFGDTAVDDLIRELVPDDAWQPGECHTRLVSLPWADVLTTNWDTLLERAAQGIAHRPYSVVRTMGDMATSHAPRIVKLHGSLPSHGPFILTQEHFRRYPDTHAAFVNLARQVFIENELVLLGFSGEDPNFVQWAGWVRDHLGGHNRRLYLVGVLNIAPSRRQLFEKMNIAAIDLAPLVSDTPEELKHKDAHLALLGFLAGGKPLAPADWPYTTFGDGLSFRSSVDDLRKRIATWKMDRDAYPGWVRCPNRIRSRMGWEVQSALHAFRRLFGTLDASEHDSALRELAWRSRMAEEDLPAWILEHLRARLESMLPTTPLDERLDISLALALASRELRDETSFEAALLALKTAGDDGIAWASYLVALRRVEELDLEGLSSAIEGISGPDLFWMVRKAGLLAQTGQITAARDLYLEAFGALRARYLREPTSQWVSSRLVWAEFLSARANMLTSAAAADDSPNHELPQLKSPLIRDPLLDPWVEIEAIGEDLRKAERSRLSTELPKFDPGTYVASFEVSTSEGPDDGWPQPMRRLLEHLGIEGGIGNVSYLRSEVRRAAALTHPADQLSFDWALSVCRQREDKVVVHAILSRVSIATWPIERAMALRQRVLRSCLHAIGRYSGASTGRNSNFDEKNFFVERIAISFEILSRLSVRLDDQSAVEWYRTVLSWGRESFLQNTLWLHEHYFILLNRAWRVLPNDAKPLFGLDHVSFPLVSNVRGQPQHYWRDVVDSQVLYTAETRASSKWGESIGTLFDAAASESALMREESIGRLFSLFRGGNLTGDENSRLAATLWAQLGSDGLPAKVRLFHFTVFELPEVEGFDSSSRFATRYFTDQVSGLTRTWTKTVTGSIDFIRSGRLAPPSAEVVSSWLNSALAWRPQPNGFGQDLASASDVARLLSLAVFPLLDEKKINDELAAKYEAFCVDVPEGLEAAYSLARRLPSFQSRGRVLIQSAIWSSDRRFLLAGVQALSTWQRSLPEYIAEWWPLLESVVAACAVPVRLGAALLWLVVAKLVPQVSPNLDLVQRLLFALDQLRAPTQYKALEGANATWQEEAPILIAAAVNTAHQLRASGVESPIVDQWIQRGEHDPLPEVRHAGSEGWSNQ